MGDGHGPCRLPNHGQRWRKDMTGTGERAATSNPPHWTEPIRESVNEVGRSVTETAARLGCELARTRRVRG